MRYICCELYLESNAKADLMPREIEWDGLDGITDAMDLSLSKLGR